MKISQNDLIVSIVAVVLGLGISTAFFFMQRKPVAPAAPTPVNLSKPELPAGAVTMANSLPGAGTSAAGGAGGPAGFAGPGGPTGGPKKPKGGMSAAGF